MSDRSKSNRKSNTKWLFIIVFWSIITCGSISLLSDMLLKSVNILVAFLILGFIIIVGIISDMLGVAVTVAQERSFHAMASKRVSGAKLAIRLIKNADKASTIFQDVIGDICGIVSGSVGVLIAHKISYDFPDVHEAILNTIIGVLIGALTIGGKAVGKNLAINNGNNVLYRFCKLIYFFKRDR
ncbi:hypothetical protein [Clostridium sp. JN-1]|uniref:hypothetical protein n=1 Tax=Clostridium sp. JN-1 TaxID=2483110 RepID=UPI000F0BB87D|nr:hypothetical protein [Clostridium sp. JN-1]